MDESAWQYSFFGYSCEGKSCDVGISIKGAWTWRLCWMDICMGGWATLRPPSRRKHAVLMFVRVVGVEVDVSSILKIRVRAVCRRVDWYIERYRVPQW